MPTSPAVLSRRSLLQGAASLTVLAALTAVTSCSDGVTRANDGDVDGPEGSELLRLGHTIAGQPGSATGPGGGAPPTRPDEITSDDAAVLAIAERDAAVRADFAAGQTIGAAGWTLSTTEAAVLVDYAGACPLPAC